jgi:DNA-binding beta-propeller fold protein YncE
VKMIRFLVLSMLLTQAAPAFAQDEEKKPEPAQEAKTEEAKPEEKQEKPQEKPAEEKPAEEKPAETPEATEAGLKVTTVLTGLNNPSGIAIQPETGTVFIADSGNLQVVKLVDGKAEPAIIEFPKDVYGKGPKVNIGPLGLAFLDKNTLVVGGGGLPDGQELLRVYTLPEDGKPIKADAMKTSFALAEDGDVKGEGNFYALAVTPEAIYVTCNGDDTKGWVSRATIKDGEVTGFERYLATKEATEVDAPVGITIAPQGGYLVVGQMGEINVPGDSLLTFYDPNSKEKLMNLKTGLHDIASVAYSPRQMYVLDYAWADPTQGGLFQIINDETAESGMRTKSILSLDKPTAMAFDSDGSLYITILGKADENSNSEGKLIQIEAGL